MLVSASCAPIAAVNNADTSEKRGEQAAATVPTAATGSAPTIMSAQVESDCAEPGARSCALDDARMPLQCSDGKWAAQPSCGTSERCETAVGPDAGLCVAIATQCLTHAPREEFCDGELVRSCEGLVLTDARKCRERRRCMEIDGAAECVCAFGWVDFGTGAGCEQPTSCATDNGGCDSLTQCSVQGTQTVCTGCPTGYEGDGKSGCSAQLTELRVEGAAISPQFSPDNHSYRVVLPLVQQHLQLMATAADGVMLDIDNVAQEPSTLWQSPPLALGEHKIAINLSTGKDVKSSYELTVTRTGTQDAYLKAAASDQDDDFGTSVAVWGDTVVVGAIYEDGTRDDPRGNALANSGGVHVYVRAADGTWTQQAHLKGNPSVANDYFGFAVAIHEDTLVVGAPGGTVLLSSAPHGGSVHVFKREAGEWRFVQRIAPDAEVADLFGQALALDDEKLVVGAPLDGTTESFSGRVYVFPREADGFGQPTSFKAREPSESGLFGIALAVEGDTMVVGAPQYNYLRSWIGAGMAYIFERSAGAWSQRQMLEPAASLEDGATYGWSVDIANGTIAIAAPRARATDEGQSPGEAFIYDRAANGGMWMLTQSLKAPVPRTSDWFAWGLQLTASTLVVGSPGDASSSLGLMGDLHLDNARDTGAVFTYGRNKDQWLLTGFVKPSNGEPPDYFGSAVAIHGELIASTSPGEASDATGVQGNQASNSLDHAGAAYVFR
jgi:hypothetical protein